MTQDERRLVIICVEKMLAVSYENMTNNTFNDEYTFLDNEDWETNLVAQVKASEPIYAGLGDFGIEKVFPQLSLQTKEIIAQYSPNHFVQHYISMNEGERINAFLADNEMLDTYVAEQLINRFPGQSVKIYGTYALSPEITIRSFEGSSGMFTDKELQSLRMAILSNPKNKPDTLISCYNIINTVYNNGYMSIEDKQAYDGLLYVNKSTPKELSDRIWAGMSDEQKKDKITNNYGPYDFPSDHRIQEQYTPFLINNHQMFDQFTYNEILYSFIQRMKPEQIEKIVTNPEIANKLDYFNREYAKQLCGIYHIEIPDMNEEPTEIDFSSPETEITPTEISYSEAEPRESGTPTTNLKNPTALIKSAKEKMNEQAPSSGIPSSSIEEIK